ncbi:MAG: hypothetical protein AAB608_00930 [Patescibacteria group bacterium]
MAGTKIIHVLKDDTFDELLGIVQGTPASEVVFILPKRSKAFSQTEDFATLASEALANEKRVTFMTPNAEVAALARDHAFEVVLNTPKGGARKKPLAALAVSGRNDVVLPSDEVMGEPDEDEGEIPDRAPFRGVDADGDGFYDDQEPGVPRKKEDEGFHEEELDADVDGTKVEEGEDVDADDVDKDVLEDDLEPSLDELTDVEAEEVAADGGSPRATLAAAPGRRLDSAIPSAIGRGRAVPVRGTQGKRSTVPLQREARVDDLATVWGAPSKEGGIWGPPVPTTEKRGSWFSRLFRRSHSQPRPVAVRGGGISTVGKIGIGITILAIAALAIYLFTPQSAHLAISPMASKLEASLPVLADRNVQEMNIAIGVMPGQFITIEKTAEQTFTSSGERDVAQKARGTVTIINAFSATPQTFIATTRLETKEGLMFRTLRTITVPGMRGTEPGKASVEVIADKPGVTYNIAPSSFVFSAFKERNDAERYAKFTATSSAPMAGGIQGKAKVATEADIVKARAAVENELKQLIADGLTDARTRAVILDGATKTSEVAITTSVLQDEAADTFTATAKQTITTVGFREEDMHAFIKESLEKKHPITVLPEYITYSVTNPIFDEKAGTLRGTVQVGGTAFAAVSSDAIRDGVRGQTREQLESFIRSQEAKIGSARVTLSPRWATKAPDDTSRISVELIYATPQPSPTSD